MPRPIAHFALQPADVLTLQGWLRMSTLEQSLAQRARILLLLNEGVTPIAIISHSHGSEQLAVSVFDVRLEDFGPELQAADPGIKKLKEVTERIGKTPPAGLKRRATK